MLLTILFLVFTTDYTQAQSQIENYTQSSGYVDVRQGAHMFYWLFYTTASVKNYTERPLIICLYGDPGTGVTGVANFGNFGPILVDQTERNHTLINNFNVMYLDSPVGSGFSYVDDPKLLTKTNLEIATDFMAFIQKFYKSNPEFKKVPLYIYGQGYGAKSAVAIASILKNAVKNGTVKANFRGIFMQNPWVSPFDHMNTWPRTLKTLALVEKDGYEKVLNAVKETERLYNSNKFAESRIQRNKTIDIITEATTALDFYDVFDGAYTTLPNTITDPTPDKPGEPRDETGTKMESYMNSDVKKMLKIPEKVQWRFMADDVYNAHNGDYMKPVVKDIEKLLNLSAVSITLLNGNNDFIANTPGQEAWISKLKWPGALIFNKMRRQPIWYNDHLQGFSKRFGNFRFYAVNRGGRNINIEESNPYAVEYIFRSVTTFG